MRIKALSRSGRELAVLDLSTEAKVDELKREFERVKGVHTTRQRWTLPASSQGQKTVALESGKLLSDYGVNDGAEITFKDLGPQVGYSTVFVIEYLSPLLVYPIFYFLGPQIYGALGFQVPGDHSAVQKLALAYFSFHYVKRILETLFVHTFSHATMPIFNLFRNTAYYAGFAAYVSYFINHPLYSPPPLERAQVALALALLAQAGNFYCHLILANLRSGGEKGYLIPKGFLFNFITCANYTCEVYGWLFFNVATQTIAGVLFMLAGFGQMAEWAVKKHARLRKLFDGKEGKAKYPRRWIIFPPFL